MKRRNPFSNLSKHKTAPTHWIKLPHGVDINFVYKAAKTFLILKTGPVTLPPGKAFLRRHFALNGLGFSECASLFVFHARFFRREVVAATRQFDPAPRPVTCVLSVDLEKEKAVGTLRAEAGGGVSWGTVGVSPRVNGDGIKGQREGEISKDSFGVLLDTCLDLDTRGFCFGIRRHRTLEGISKRRIPPNSFLLLE